MLLKSELEQVNMFYNITYRLRLDHYIVTGYRYSYNYLETETDGKQMLQLLSSRMSYSFFLNSYMWKLKKSDKIRAWKTYVVSYTY